MIIIKVIREHDEVYVSIMKNKDDGTYSYVNLTKCHICQCRFDTVEDAIMDLEKYKKNNKIKSYIIEKEQ